MEAMPLLFLFPMSPYGNPQITYSFAHLMRQV